MLLLTLRDIQFRRSRTAIVIASTSLVFALVLLMSGLTSQFHREPVQTVAAIGGDHWILAEGSTGAFTSAATLPDGTVDAIGPVGPDLGPLAYGRFVLDEQEGPTDIVIIGFVPGALGTPSVTDGDADLESGEAVIAGAAKIAIGATARLGGRDFTITGTTAETTLFAGMPVVFLTIDDARTLLFRDRPIVSAAVSSREVAAPPGTHVVTGEAVAEDALRPLEGAIGSVDLIRMLLWLVAALLIGAVVYLAALERTRDVAVLAAVGVATRTVAGALALHALLIAVISSAVATFLYRVIEPAFPLSVHVEREALVTLPIVAIVVALVASAAGVRRISRVDPALAFAGPGG